MQTTSCKHPHSLTFNELVLINFPIVLYFKLLPHPFENGLDGGIFVEVWQQWILIWLCYGVLSGHLQNKTILNNNKIA